MGVHKRGPTTPEMNMTPLIDVTFQLIIFFMIVSNIVSEQTVEMVVPELEDSQAYQLGDQDKVVVNVEPPPFDRKDRRADGSNDHLQADGQAAGIWVGIKQYAPNETDKVTAQLKAARERNPEVQVLLRADSALYYREVQQVMAAIAAAQIKTVNLVAYRHEDDR
ncbi:MAG: biopolymer transporter ExbD [Phycisphaeraceae bacterium]|nr:biopolymer transporter ExbD [Phycisphaeraceae bacterium]